MFRKTGLMALGAASLLLTACTPPVPSAVAAVNDKVYTVTPDAMKVKAGMVTGEVTEMKITERVEAGSGRITAPAKLSGKLSLKNTSADQTMRMVTREDPLHRHAGQADRPRGQPHRAERPGGGAELRQRRTGSIRGRSRATTLDAEFPAAALKAKNLREVRLELSFIPSQFKEETLNFKVSIGGQ